MSDRVATPTRPEDPMQRLDGARREHISMLPSTITNTTLVDAGEEDQPGPTEAIKRVLYSGAQPLDVSIP